MNKNDEVFGSPDKRAVVAYLVADGDAYFEGYEGYGGAVGVRRCFICDTPYPHWTLESNMTCPTCRYHPNYRIAIKTSEVDVGKNDNGER